MFDDEPIVLAQPTYIPDQKLYPGLTFPSYKEMKEACPMLETMLELCDKKGIQYTPYKVRYEKGAEA
jgi:hypothetical protein